MNAALKKPSVRGTQLEHEPMARHTSWRVGGPADLYFEPADRADLLDFVRTLPAGEPLLWLGLGSNLLVRDGGVRGTVICLHGVIDSIRIEHGEPSGQDGSAPIIYAEAGAHCARVAKFAEREGTSGLGFMAGIPGTVGGALAMNAGAWGGETWPVVSEVEVLLRDASTHWLTPAAFITSYRQVEAPQQVLGYLAARFAVTADADGTGAKATKESLAQRKATQPVGKPSAGSTFRNPVGDHAARLIESCGLKGYRIGGAQVSMQHANFLITEDGACAADVEALIAHIAQVVKTQTGIELHSEVKIVGEQA